MNKTAILGNVHQFTAKAPKEGKPARMITKLCTSEPDPESLALLCAQPSTVLRAMQAVKATGGKYEVPADGQEAVIHVYDRDEDLAYETALVSVDKVVLDYTGDEPHGELHYDEPLNDKAVLFLLANLGQPITVCVAPAQMTLPGAENPAKPLKDFVDNTPGVDSVTLSTGDRSVTVTSKNKKQVLAAYAAK